MTTRGWVITLPPDHMTFEEEEVFANRLNHGELSIVSTAYSTIYSTIGRFCKSST